MPSRWERALVEQLTFAARDLNAPWPWGEPIPQFHVDWCCEHLKSRHQPPRLGRERPDGSPEPWHCQDCPCDFNDDDSPCLHEYRKGRDWAIDAAYPDFKVAVEYEGIVYASKGGQVGRHQTGVGMRDDLAKYAWLGERGWLVVRVGQREVSSGVALNMVQAALQVATAAREAHQRLTGAILGDSTPSEVQSTNDVGRAL